LLGLIYILGCVCTGYMIILKIKPYMEDIFSYKTLKNENVNLLKSFIYIPFSYTIGTIVVTWFTYIIAFLMRNTDRPLVFSNISTFSVFILVFLYLYFYFRDDKEKKFKIKENLFEICLVTFITLFVSFIMIYTFYYKENTFRIGHSVWGDFGPHIAVIRSFSKGLNFPTEYPHFPAGNIRYHFLFQFHVANLEFLGLRLDMAMNIPSILSLISFMILLYSFAVILTGKRIIGLLTVILFSFRSSYAFISFFNKSGTINGYFSEISRNTTYIGNTVHENWGLWTQNVYVNQRHFAISLSVMMIILILVYPLFYKMMVSFKKDEKPLQRIKGFMLSGTSWVPESIKRSVFIGVLLGLIGFWNGAVFMSILLILLGISIFSKHRLEFFNIALISGLMVFIETTFFIGNDNSALNFVKQIGFLADKKDITGISKYIGEAFGLIFIFAVAGLIFLKGRMKLLLLAFLLPSILAFTYKVTPDINANHKFIMISVMLLNIFIAYILYQLIRKRNPSLIFISIILIISLTLTGVIDFITLININKGYVGIKKNDEVAVWVEKNTNENDIFLTDVHVLHPILSAGRKIYYGWPYYAWSAGYETDKRKSKIKKIYGSDNKNELKNLVYNNGIDFLVIEAGNRNSKEYKLNEELIKETFELVYSNKGRNITIYKTSMEESYDKE
jgi:hypothetical protein